VICLPKSRSSPVFLHHSFKPEINSGAIPITQVAILLICDAKLVPLIETKRINKVMLRGAFIGLVYPILSSAANLGKKGLLFSEINSVISNTPPTKRGGSEGHRRAFNCAHNVGTITEC